MQTFAQSANIPVQPPSRAESLDRLDGGAVDVLVIGGGIIGAGVAALAARTGLRVALVERADFGAGTSSASSKLVHGGLRYLRMGDFRLVREALHETRVLGRTVAPHLVDGLTFVLPVYRAGPYGRASIRAALGLYAGLTGSIGVRGRIVNPAEAVALVPALRREGLVAAGIYPDAQTNDARLCLANVRAAAEAGATVVSRLEAVAVERAGDGLAVGLVDQLSGRALTAVARAVVNASGPAVDEVRRLEDPQAGTSVALSKGVHLVLERTGPWDAALTIPVDRTRVSFALPWEGLLLLGTTDQAYESGEPLEATPREQAQILAEAGRALEPQVIRPEAIRSSFAGLRVLPLTGGATARAPREVALSRGRLGMVSVAGGKLTTYRLIAANVLRALRADLGMPRLATDPTALPGAADPAAVEGALLRERAELDPSLARHLARTYGTHAHELLARADGRPDALEPLAAGGLDVVAQALYARDVEWACTPDDVVRRRTTLALRGLDSPTLHDRLRELLDERPPEPAI